MKLRMILGGETWLNFPGFNNTNLTPEEKTFEEVVKELDAQLKEKITPDYCQKFINSNVALEKNPIIKVAPRFLKTFFMNLSFYLVG